MMKHCIEIESKIKVQSEFNRNRFLISTEVEKFSYGTNTSYLGKERKNA